MDPAQARQRFAAARVARLATVDDLGCPHLVPIVFATDGADGVVTAVDRKPKRTTRLRRLHNIEVTPAVCLLADDYDEDWSRLWWVRADGGARIVPPGAPDLATREEYEAALVRLRAKYPQYRDAPPDGPVVAVTVHAWTGWQADASPAARPGG
ncbi:TIGR03668 family PPOX class F420-dependent oxidoreductase [Streptomyces mexicanus]|jgi:PPOX class probable F420-dependent enzyme|uniref:TIGR03668 family PPOX class F420-dependent oxidoreductase n=2 Tax=Streptomyces mexicanus TaxID=178566 RepID=A0A7X1HY07_9ACTN|nr:TIGR03668 family PPOX class F420-dependent oxidoreductase [Streptomyces mexicanus]MBC2865111.1 TIGR03668 family PPOX class F420-dependent oxidoreductase [Streptomyces mexicanus]